MKCNHCPRKCNVNRKFQKGFCQASNKLMVAHVCVHNGEEPCISGARGSGTIFFCHCNLKCEFCQNAPIRDAKIGKLISVKHLTSIFKRLESQNVHNINLVSPTQYSKQIISALKLYKPKIPIIYNTNGYEDEEILKELDSLVDIFLIDLKFYDKSISNKYCHSTNYFECASKALKVIKHMLPVDIFEQGILHRGTIIRHLILPNNTDDSKKIIDYLSNNYPSSIVSLMSQFLPCDNAKTVGLNRTLRPIEYNQVVRYARQRLQGIVYVQELNSATSEYIPNWDISTV